MKMGTFLQVQEPQESVSFSRIEEGRAALADPTGQFDMRA